VLGLHENASAQIAFVDTPGIHHGAKRALNRAMNRTAATVLADADVCVFVLEALQWTGEDDLVLGHLVRSGRPVLAAVNKVDKIHPRERLLPFLAELAHRHAFAEIIPISATKHVNLEPLLGAITRLLPVSPPLCPTGQVTDRDLAFRISEMIREKLTLELDQELPYGIAVEIEAMGEDEGQLNVAAAIWVDRAGQKPIVIGAGGERLKRIGRKARLELNHVLGERLHLTLWVKVRESWADSARALTELGLE
jgi:GTP-binding protein Era